MKFVFKNLFIFLFSLSASVMAQTLHSNFPVTNGTVNVMVQSGNNLFLGGSFSSVGPNTGRGVGIDATTGNYISGFPDVNGQINAVVSDDAGGWYIGGVFTQVGGVARSCIAHIKSDKTVDTWNPNINDGGVDNLQKVFTLTKYGSTIYVGGLFTQVGSAIRGNVAAIDSATGLATTWNPSPDNTVYSIIVTPQYTFLGGVFTTFAGAIDSTTPGNIPAGIPSNKRQGVAELFTGQNILTQWNTTIAGGTNTGQGPYGNIALGVYAMQLINGRLYCGGNFGSLGGNNAMGVTSIDTANTYYPTPTGFNPNRVTILKYRPIYALANSGDTLFVGGGFGNFGSNLTVRNHIAAVLISTGASGTQGTTISTWNPNIALNGNISNENSYPYYVNSMVVSNGTLYVSGKFTTINTIVSRNNIAAINQSGTGIVTSWNPNASDAVQSIALHGNSIYAGGNFTSVNGQTRNNLCEINAASGTLTSWNPNSNNAVQALVFSGNTLFVGGAFTNIGGQSRSNIAGIDSASGLATAWQANTNFSVSSLAVNAGMLYAGGVFTQIGGIGVGDSVRSYIAQIDTAVTAGVSLWNANADGSVSVLAASGSSIYAAGTFLNIGGQARNIFAALDATTSLATSWNPNPTSSVNSIAISGLTVYAGGTFTNIGGAARNSIAALDATTGLSTAWDPNITGTSAQVNAITVNGSTVYAGGVFAQVGASTRNNAAAIDVSTGNATSWNPNANGGVNALLVDHTNHAIYLGGAFSNLLENTASSFAVVDNPGDVALPVELTAFTATIKGPTAELRWTTATEVNNYGFEVEKSIRNSELGIRNWAKVGFVNGGGNSSSPKQYFYSDNIGLTGANGTYSYRLKQIDNDGKFKYSSIVEINSGSIPTRFELDQNYPNPFNPATTISYSIPTNNFVTLKVFNILGQEVVLLVNENQVAGKYTVTFNAGNLTSGVYLFRVDAGSFHAVKKMLLIK